MKILSANQIRETDAYTIKNEPIKSINLMERAATQCYEWLIDRFDMSVDFKIFCGTGNNGGDGLVVARMLSNKGYKVEVFIVRYSQKCSDDFNINEKRLLKLKNVPINDITPENTNRVKDAINCVSTSNKLIIIDAIFGSGLSRPVEGFVADVICHIYKSDAGVVAIDIPSGLFAEDNSNNIRKNIVKADHTLSLELPKLAFMFPENEDYVGEWHVLPIGLNKQFISELPSQNYYITKDIAKSLIKPRAKFSHKGNYGHALLVSGSYGMIGAAVLASKACLRAGAGLLTTHIPKCGYEIMQAAAPEAMVDIDSSEHVISGNIEISKYNAIGIGPGIGKDEKTQTAIKLIIQNSSLPLVIDADAINIIAENKTWIPFVPKGSIFTPHPKEFERLAGKTSNNYERFLLQTQFAKKYQVYVLLKVAHTAIACPDGNCYFNSTGNPGMATGGSGDVLTGMILGLLAQGYSPKEASILGVYLHGSAGDEYAFDYSHEKLIASDIIDRLGDAFGAIYESD
ncbi:MAG: NAD(P)H-hydrate dehydratase [Bacteroidota bacterium]